MGLCFVRRTFFYVSIPLFKTSYLEINHFTLIFECLITETLGFGKLFSAQNLCCPLLTFILNPITSAFHFFGKAAGGIFEHLPISRGITPHLLRGLTPLAFNPF